MFRVKQPLAEHFQKLCSGEIKAEPPLPPEKVRPATMAQAPWAASGCLPSLELLLGNMHLLGDPALGARGQLPTCLIHVALLEGV